MNKDLGLMKILGAIAVSAMLIGCSSVPAADESAGDGSASGETRVPVLEYPAKNPDVYEPGNGWTLSWSDEFEGTTLDENVWTRQKMMFPYNNELQRYTAAPETARVEDGNMILTVERIKEGSMRGSFTSARVISNPGGEDGNSAAEGKTFLYGKIAARIQVPYGRGLWPAFWMLGDNCSETGGDAAWPGAGEIDILESGSVKAPNYGQGTVSGALHHDPSPGNTRKQNLCLDSALVTLPNGELMGEKFRVYEIEWDKEKIVWKLDGVQFGEMSISEDTRDEFHKPFYVLFNVAVGGNFTVSPDETTVFPQYMYVDWIRHYTR